MVKLRWDGRSYQVTLSKTLIEKVLHWKPGCEITQELEGNRIILEMDEKELKSNE